MKNSQRIIGLGLATICTATMLVGCGSKTEYEDTSNIGGVEQEEAIEEVEDELEDVTNSEDGGIEEEVEDALEDETDELDELEVDAEDTSEETEE